MIDVLVSEEFSPEKLPRTDICMDLVINAAQRMPMSLIQKQLTMFKQCLFMSQYMRGKKNKALAAKTGVRRDKVN